MSPKPTSRKPGRKRQQRFSKSAKYRDARGHVLTIFLKEKAADDYRVYSRKKGTEGAKMERSKVDRFPSSAPAEARFAAVCNLAVERHWVPMEARQRWDYEDIPTANTK